MPKTPTRKLKVFQAQFGFFDTVLAAPSQAAALRAWGTHRNLFATGHAKLATDDAAMAAYLERIAHVLQGLQGAPGRERHPDGVEAETTAAGAPAARWPAPQPLCRHGSQLPALGVSDRVEPACRPRAPSGDPRLHLAEHDASLAGGHEVELPVARAEVALEDLETALDQMGRRDAFAKRASGSSRVDRHSAKLGSRDARVGYERDDFATTW